MSHHHLTHWRPPHGSNSSARGHGPLAVSNKGQNPSFIFQACTHKRLSHSGISILLESPQHFTIYYLCLYHHHYYLKFPPGARGTGREQNLWRVFICISEWMGCEGEGGSQGFVLEGGFCCRELKVQAVLAGACESQHCLLCFPMSKLLNHLQPKGADSIEE